MNHPLFHVSRSRSHFLFERAAAAGAAGRQYHATVGDDQCTLEMWGGPQRNVDGVLMVLSWDVNGMVGFSWDLTGVITVGGFQSHGVPPCIIHG